MYDIVTKRSTLSIYLSICLPIYLSMVLFDLITVMLFYCYASLLQLELLAVQSSNCYTWFLHWLRVKSWTPITNEVDWIQKPCHLEKEAGAV